MRGAGDTSPDELAACRRWRNKGGGALGVSDNSITALHILITEMTKYAESASWSEYAEFVAIRAALVSARAGIRPSGHGDIVDDEDWEQEVVYVGGYALLTVECVRAA